MATQMVNQTASSNLFCSGAYTNMPLENDLYGLHELSKAEMTAPRLIMLANVALTGEMSNSCCDYTVDEERQMAELTTVNDNSFSDSEGERMDDSPVMDIHSPNSEMMDLETTEPPKACMSESSVTLPSHNLNEESQKDLEVTSTKDDKSKCLKSKPFRCKPCQYKAESEEEFIHHIKIHSAKIHIDNDSKTKSQGKESDSSVTEETDISKGPIQCDRCGYNTNRFDHYLAHLKHHNKAGESERVYKCTICTYTTVSEYHWKKHLRNHYPRILYTCSQCSYFSDRKNNYIQHIRTHTGERPYQCIICPYSSSQKTHLTRHMRTHSGEKPFKCEQCSYVASNQHEVTRHARQVHNGPKPLTCPHCDYKTADRSNFKKHVELHVNPRQFLCPVCDYAASKKCNLQYHIKSRHSGCTNITMDVSKVKLRTKKGEVGAADADESKQIDNENVKSEIESVGTKAAEKKESCVKGKKRSGNSIDGQVTKKRCKSSAEKKNKHSEIRPVKVNDKKRNTKCSKRKSDSLPDYTNDAQANPYKKKKSRCISLKKTISKENTDEIPKKSKGSITRKEKKYVKMKHRKKDVAKKNRKKNLSKNVKVQVVNQKNTLHTETKTLLSEVDFQKDALDINVTQKTIGEIGLKKIHFSSNITSAEKVVGNVFLNKDLSTEFIAEIEAPKMNGKDQEADPIQSKNGIFEQEVDILGDKRVSENTVLKINTSDVLMQREEASDLIPRVVIPTIASVKTCQTVGILPLERCESIVEVSIDKNEPTLAMQTDDGKPAQLLKDSCKPVNGSDIKDSLPKNMSNQSFNLLAGKDNHTADLQKTDSSGGLITNLGGPADLLMVTCNSVSDMLTEKCDIVPKLLASNGCINDDPAANLPFCSENIVDSLAVNKGRLVGCQLIGVESDMPLKNDNEVTNLPADVNEAAAFLAGRDEPNEMVVKDVTSWLVSRNESSNLLAIGDEAGGQETSLSMPIEIGSDTTCFAVPVVPLNLPAKTASGTTDFSTNAQDESANLLLEFRGKAYGLPKETSGELICPPTSPNLLDLTTENREPSNLQTGLDELINQMQGRGQPADQQATLKELIDFLIRRGQPISLKTGIDNLMDQNIWRGQSAEMTKGLCQHFDLMIRSSQPAEVRTGLDKFIDQTGRRQLAELTVEQEQLTKLTIDIGQPVDLTVERQQPIDLMLDMGQPSDLEKPINLTAERVQPMDLTLERGQPVDLTLERGQPVDLTAGGGQPLDLTAEGGQPVDLTAEGGQPVDLTAEGGQPVDLTAEGGQPVDLTAEGGQPVDLTAEGGQPTNLAWLDKFNLTMEKGMPTEHMIGFGVPVDFPIESFEPIDLSIERCEPIDLTVGRERTQ
ncbi:hypothetical protein GDO86_000942 [Hymenochirus boettgeri]|uniref:C2H2-type domain-containing protein n=1 Tax=Hymenochirus boettgeri TaxID=247094 RepID=A0A8T2KF65_9PIPI|nr:hypothetical protein GDO86_000942 [Hymenochirus boettgeri]